MIKLKTDSDIEILRLSGKILRDVLDRLINAARPGVRLSFLDKLAFDLIASYGGKPAFLHYRPEGAAKPYPASICASLNECIVHGIPDNYSLKEGDILKLDLGVDFKGRFTDSAKTVIIGDKASKDERMIVHAVNEALEAAIAVCEAGNKLGDIGAAVEGIAKKHNVSVVEGLAGHGVGFMPHEDPLVWNYGRANTGMTLNPGLVIAIEPMFCLGDPEIVENHDGSYSTLDGSTSAHAEHTIAITDSGSIVLTA